MQKIYYHLPGLFEFYEFYKKFLQLWKEHRDYFYDWCDIGSIYGAPFDCLWGGGRVGFGEANEDEVLELVKEYEISPRFTFSNSFLQKEHLTDRKCNDLLRLFDQNNGGIILASDLLLEYVKEHFSSYYLVSSTTKVLTDFQEFLQEVQRDEFAYVVPDFRLNKCFEQLETLSQEEKNKVEFLCNECCFFACKDRKKCYENVSLKNLGENCEDHVCMAPKGNQGYRFSEAMKNPGFIGIEEIQKEYLPRGFSNFKIEGRGLGSAMILEFLLYYMVKPECELVVREEIYLDSMLDLF